MKKWLMAILFGTVLTLGACGGGGDDGGNGGGDANGGNSGGGNVDAEAANEVFQNNCMSCHGEDLGGAMGPDLTSVGADHSKEDIIDIIQNGKGQMPAQNLSEEDADTVAQWLANKK